MRCGAWSEDARKGPCSARVVYRANFNDDPELADIIVPLCGAHALTVENAGRTVIPLVRRMYEGGVFA